MGFKLKLTAEEVKNAQGGFTPLPEGVYSATIYDAKEATSKAGNDMYVLDFLITDGPEVRKNYKIKSWFVVTGNALFSVVGLLKALNMPYPNIKDLKNGGNFDFPDATDFLGLEVNLKIVQESYKTVDEAGNSEDEDGNPILGFRNNVKSVLKFDPDKVTQAGDADESANSGLFL